MDLSETVVDCVRALVVRLDSGRLVLTDRAGALPADAAVPAVLSWGAIGGDGAALEIEAQALPPHAAGDWWISRRAELRECRAGQTSAAAGTLLFDGVVAAQPDQTAGVWSLRLTAPRRRVRPVPDLGVVASDTWPLAAEAVAGARLPEIFGTVEGCPLLPVALAAATTLSADAMPGDGQIEVDDATLLPASGAVWVDGRLYAYPARSESALLGVAVTAAHRRGTAAVAEGESVFLAAGHAVTAIEALRSGGRPVSGGSVDPAAALVRYASPPLVLERAERFTLTAHFDQLGAGTTALNAINAIRAVTSTPSQTAVSLPSAVTADTSGAVIAFARPAGRIVAGAYSVAFTVSIGAQIGWARVRIGNDLVWHFEPPASVLYDASPAAFFLDDDTDFVPVSVEVAEGGSRNQVSVTVTAASRIVSLGNLDDGNFAILRSAAALTWRADQTDTLPDRGRIVSASLWVRWFGNGAAGLPAVSAKFAGRSLGALAQTPLSSATLSQTVRIDSVTQGSAAFPTTPVATTVSGGTASLSHATLAMQASVTTPQLKDVGAGVLRGYAPFPSPDGWSSDLGSITVKLMMQASSVSDAESKAGVTAFVEYLNSSGSPVNSGIAAGTTETLVSGQMYAVVRTLSFVPYALRFVSVGWTAANYPLHSVLVAWNSRITTAASLANTAASGSSAALGAQDLPNRNIAVAMSGGSISFTVPAPPRVVDSVFPLSWVSEWSQLTGQAEIVAAAGGADICLNQVALLVEYDAPVYQRADSITATVTGRDGNPAAVIDRLAAASGQTIAPEARARLSAWCAANGLAFGRRISEASDALELLDAAAAQAAAALVETEDGLAPVRWLDLSESPTIIAETDLLAPAQIGWADRVETDITLRYRPDAGGAGWLRARRASAANSATCRRGEEAMGESRPVELEAAWLRDDTAAAAMLDAHVGRFGRPRRLLTLVCPFAVTARRGDLVEYLPLGVSAGFGVFARITDLSDDAGWPTLRAEEIHRS